MRPELPDADEPDPKQLERFDRYLYKQRQSRLNAIAKLYGELPDWLSELIEPVHFGIEQSLVTLRNLRQPFKRIADCVRQHRKGELQIPGGVRDVADFIKAVNYLARVQAALELDKSRAIQELGGTLAAKTHRDLRRGKEEQDANLRQRNEKLRAEASALRTQNPRLTTNAIATRLAPNSGLSVKQIARIIRI